MNKKFIILLVVLIVLALGFGLFFYYNQNLAGLFPSGGVPQKEEASFKTEKILETVENPPYYEINFEYPQFSNIKGAQDIINGDIKENTVRISEEFKNNLFETCSNKDFKCTLINSYKVYYMNDKAVSLSFNYYAYSGGAHGLTTTLMLNYQTSDGKKILLEDIFKKDSQYLNKISDYCIKVLKEKLAVDGIIVDEDWVEKGAAPIKENYASNVGFSEYGLVIVFAQYQVAPYASGEQMVMIPYSEIEEFIDPNGILGNFAKK